MNRRGLFPAWALASVITVAVLTALAALLLSGGDEADGGLFEPATPGAYSRSAIGHAGVAALLERAGIPVRKSGDARRRRAPSNDVMVYAEPRVSLAEEQKFRRMIGGGNVLLVLPKWTAQPSAERPGWIENAELLPDSEAERVLRLASPKARLVHVAGGAKWTWNMLGPVPAPALPMQLAKGPGLRPIVAAGDGILIGEIARGNGRLWVLSDPDVIANHGIGHDGNADFAIALFSALRAAGGDNVRFVETGSGSAAGSADPLRLLLRRPLVFCTVQAGLAALLLLWAAAARFGAAEEVPPALEAGRQRLLRNTAGLLEYAGYEALVVARYVEATTRYVAGQLHSPRGLAGDSLIAWLERVGRVRGVALGCIELMRRAAQLRAGNRADRKTAAGLARDTDRWKREIIDGSGQHSRRR